jgi:hypothetical protein
MDFYGAEINCEQFKVVIKSASPESFILANAVSKKFYPNHTSVLKTKFILCVNHSRDCKSESEVRKKPSAHSAPSLNPALGTIFPPK